MKPRPHAAAFLACLALAALAGGARAKADDATAADAKMAADSKAAGPLMVAPGTGEVVAVLVLTSDTSLGPNMDEADTAVRYYCSEHGKMYELVSKERPPEFASQVFRQWSLLTYRCVSPAAK